MDDRKDRTLTVTESGVPVPERITNVQAARRLYEKFKDAWNATAKRRARLKGMIDGNPPHDPAVLRDMGLGYMTNVNFLEARSILDQKAAAFYELFFEVPTLVEVKQKFFPQGQQDTLDFGSIIAEEFTEALHSWPGFLQNMLKARRESDAYGLGVMLWRDEWDWRPKAFAAANWLVDPMAELDVNVMNFFFMRDRLSAGDLYRLALMDEAKSARVGWDPAAVKRTLVDVYNREAQASLGSETQFGTSSWEAIQQRIRNNDWWTQTAEFELVNVLHLMVREVASGKVSHYILTEKQFAEDPSLDKFLFKAKERFASMDQCLWILPYNDGDGYLKSIRGLASMIEPHCDLSNRFLGQVFDAGRTTASLVLQPATETDASKIQLIRMGMITVVPPGMQALQSTFQPQISPLVQLRDLSSDIMRNNTGVWRQQTETFLENQPQKTARQVAYEESREARMEKANVAYDYLHIERLYREMFRRMTNPEYINSQADLPGQKEARAFVARCVLRGVPVDLLLSAGAFKVNVTRAIGMGSWGVKLDLTNQILNARGMLDEIGQRNALRDWLAVRSGYTNVDRYARAIDRNTIPSNEASIATLENNDMAEGSTVPVGSDQTHMLHLNVHVPPIVRLQQAYSQDRGVGMDLKGIIRLLGQLLPHCESHVQFLSQDPARQPAVDQIMAVLKAGMQLYRDVAAEITKRMKAQAQAQESAMMQQAQQAQQAQSAADQVKMYEIQEKYRLEGMKQASLNQMRAEKTGEQMEIAREKASAAMQLDAQRQAAELEMKARAAEAEMAIKQAKAGA